MKGCPVLKNPRNSIKPGSGIIYVTPVLEDAACIFGMWSQFCFDCYSGAISAISRGPAASGGDPITRSPKKINKRSVSCGSSTITELATKIILQGAPLPAEHSKN